jgi:8-oxo-dGTP diphosphatase
MPWSADTRIKVAVGILINADREVLVALRPAHNPHGGLWEFPGGKFENSESPFDALKRELNEEIGVEVLTATPLICIEHDYGAVSVELNTWRVDTWRGTPYGRESQEIRWVNHEAIAQLNFPDGNAAIVEKVIKVLNSPEI